MFLFGFMEELTLSPPAEHSGCFKNAEIEALTNWERSSSQNTVKKKKKKTQPATHMLHNTHTHKHSFNAFLLNWSISKLPHNLPICRFKWISFNQRVNRTSGRMVSVRVLHQWKKSFYIFSFGLTLTQKKKNYLKNNITQLFFT